MTLLLVWLHLLAAVAWIGGMVFLSLVLVPILRHEPFALQRGALIRAVALRFRLVVWVAIGVLLTTGPLLLLSRGLSFGDPGGRPAVLAVKLILIAILLALTIHRKKTGRAMHPSRDPPFQAVDESTQPPPTSPFVSTTRNSPFMWV